MKKSVYYQAAVRVAEERDEYSCIALKRVIDPNARYSGDLLAVQEYLHLFTERGYAATLQLNIIFDNHDEDSQRHLRVMLLLMADQVLGGAT